MHDISVSYEHESKQIADNIVAGSNIEIEQNKAEEDCKEVRTENKYFSYKDEKEVARLREQQRLIKTFDGDVYKSVFDNGREGFTVLDVGTSDGSLIIDRLSPNEKLGQAICVENDQAATDYANCTYTDKRFKFYQCDIEGHAFEGKIAEIMKENNIKEFDFIHISLVILHLKNPYIVLKKLKKFLKKDGIIFIKDIDDGLNLTYPDKNGNFERLIKICAYDKLSGYRKSGREIMYHLNRLGFRRIKIEKSGFDSLGMTPDEKQALFDVYFGFIYEDLRILSGENPTDKTYKEDFCWFSQNYCEIEEEFLDSNLFFSLGLMLITAKK